MTFALIQKDSWKRPPSMKDYLNKIMWKDLKFLGVIGKGGGGEIRFAIDKNNWPYVVKISFNSETIMEELEMLIAS